jgi:hypothetical protein
MKTGWIFRVWGGGPGESFVKLRKSLSLAECRYKSGTGVVLGGKA